MNLKENSTLLLLFWRSKVLNADDRATAKKVQGYILPVCCSESELNASAPKAADLFQKMEKTTTHAVRHVAEEVVDLTPRLQEKVRSQAEELASLYASLQRSTAYSKLCEKRLLEVCPSHQLPVTLAHLHENENSRPPTVLGHNNPIVLNAVQRKTERDVTRKLSALNDKVQALELVKSDLSLKLKECRSQLQSKEKSVNSLTRTNHELSIRIDQLKSKVSSTSSVIPTSLDISSRQVEPYKPHYLCTISFFFLVLFFF